MSLQDTDRWPKSRGGKDRKSRKTIKDEKKGSSRIILFME